MDNAQDFAQDREDLITFLNDTYRFVQNIYEGNDPQSKQIVPNDLREMLLSAWSEFEGDFNLDEAQNRIRSLSEERMIAFGLYGAQLRLKLTIIARLRSEWLDFGGDNILKKLIDAIDTLLDSLIAATGINEALKELKDILRGLLD